jgi:hypothetical protein
MRARTALGGFAVCIAAVAAGQGGGRSEERQLYEVTTALDMPHLEENLRYAITHEQRCLAPQELRRLFPILQHPALAGCHLGPESMEGDIRHAELACEGNHGTTGTMQWHSGPGPQSGVLHIRLGGKNMTFSQTVTARALGHCQSLDHGSAWRRQVRPQSLGVAVEADRLPGNPTPRR